jgi:formyl-CoA transferase/CoA:oxalate CoA-transferase
MNADHNEPITGTDPPDAARGGPLNGLTILDLTRNLAGPFCTMILADMGARVIKVERPKGGDDTRQWRPPAWGTESSLFLAVNRNKESLALDIDTDAGAEVIRRLATSADILVESFKGGSLAKRKLDFASVSATNPRLVYCSMSGFGSRGPHAERPGYDTLVQAYSGIMSITGEPGGRPVRTGPSIIDMTTGMWGALGTVMALRHRDLTGRGQHVETSLLETGIVWMSYFIAGFLADGTVAGPMGSAHSLIAPYEEFRTRDGFVFVAAPNNGLFAKLCATLGTEALPQDPRFRMNPDRLKNRPALHDALEAAFRTADTRDWEMRLQAQGIPCSRIQSVDMLVDDPQVQALQLIRRYAHPTIADLRLVDHPISYDGTRSFRHDGAPALGQHTRAILQSLGYGDAEIGAMVRDGTTSMPDGA